MYKRQVPIKPQDRTIYGQVENLPLELYFSDDTLRQGGVEHKYTISMGGIGDRDLDRTQIEGLGLQPEKHYKFANREQKASFARRIADRPNKSETPLDLHVDEFQGFIPLFETIQALLVQLT